ncbi:MAG: pyrroline-5-carboxylate reductase dimerization domain-containing protein [Candidatus Paceibacterota bacterium]|jgi:pyrroline-5-carboxylate reductase
MSTKVTIIGFGTMGKAIAKAISKKDPKIAVFSIDKDKPNLKNFIEKVKKSDFIIFAVKPQEAKEAFVEIKNYLNKKTILISIMAGVSIKELIHLSGHKKIIRMMPNLGLSVGYGIAAWRGVGISLLEKKKVKNFINKITENFEVKNEDTINKVTAISGSGPAYFFLLADCLIKACDNLGLNKNESQQLVEKTFSAAAILSKESDYSSLIKKVASKGGTTEAALNIFQKENFSGIVSKAVLSAYKRAQELGQNK